MRRQEFFRITVQMLKDKQDSSGASYVKDEDGITTTDEQSKCRRYMEKLFNIENVWDCTVECDLVDGMSWRIAEEEVVKVVLLEPGFESPFATISKIGHFVLSIEAPVDSAV